MDSRERKWREVLESVRDSYWDFVEGMIDYFRDEPAIVDQVSDYICKNPESKTDDIIEFYESICQNENIAVVA